MLYSTVPPSRRSTNHRRCWAYDAGSSAGRGCGSSRGFAVRVCPASTATPAAFQSLMFVTAVKGIVRRESGSVRQDVQSPRACQARDLDMRDAANLDEIEH